MKLAIVRQRYNPFGGAERFVERALGALVDQGTTVSLITRNWSGAVADSRYRTIICDPAPAWMSGRKGRDAAFSAGVQAILAQEDFDLVQSHERIPGCHIFRAGDGVHAAWLARRAALLGPLARMAQGFSSYHRYVVRAEREMFGHSALRSVICNSRMVADEVAHYYGVPESKLAVIYNGVDTDDFHPGLRARFRLAQRAELSLPLAAPVLLYVGSGYERKGVPQLLLALASLKRSDVYLVIVGADRKLKAIRRLAASLGVADRCRFVGASKDVRPFYGMADGFVLPSIYDPGPNAALEALACGLPMLTSEGCGAKEWIRAGENGEVVDPLDARQFGEKLAAFVDMMLSSEAGVAARKSVAHLDLERMAETLLRLYRTLDI